MSHHHHHHHHHHQSVDNLINVFARASHDLTVVHSKLEKEFQQTYPDNANPMKLVLRIKKLQEDVAVLKDQCLELLSAKQVRIKKRLIETETVKLAVESAEISFGFGSKRLKILDLVDKAQTTLVVNCNLIQKMNTSLGESTNGNADDALADFNQIIDEWTMQVRSRTVGETEEADKEDINKMLFSAIVHTT